LGAQHGTLILPSRRKVDYYIYLPAGFNRHSARKYPLVIGCTFYVIANRVYQFRPHGPPWAQAIANCGAFVVIVDRPSWWGDIDKWGESVMAVYDLLVKNPTVDRRHVFLYGASAETQYLSEVLVKHPALWSGALLLNPGTLPDLSRLPRGQSGPRMLMSLGELEHGDERMKRYQQEALNYGTPVEFVVHKGATHWLQGKTAVCERTQAMIRFLFDE
jgi:dipeptidyl aminopeptidase/acylaminoacyl peptidase